MLGAVLLREEPFAELFPLLRGDDPMGVVRDRTRNEPYIQIKWEDRAKEVFWPGGRGIRDPEWAQPVMVRE